MCRRIFQRCQTNNHANPAAKFSGKFPAWIERWIAGSAGDADLEMESLTCAGSKNVGTHGRDAASTVCGCGQGGGADASECMGRGPAQATDRGGKRQRAGVFRLRHGRLAGHLSDERLATGREMAGGRRADIASLQEQSRRNIHRRDREIGNRASRLADGSVRWGLRQRRLGRSVLLLLGTQYSFPQQRRRHVHGCDEEGRRLQRKSALGRGLYVAGLRSRRASGSFRVQLHSTGSGSDCLRRAMRLRANGKEFR